MFAVDLDELAETVATLAHCETALDELLSDVTQRVAELHGVWSGRAALAQTEAQQSWEAGFLAMREGLAAMRAAGDVAGTAYRAAVAANRQMWEQLA